MVSINPFQSIVFNRQRVEMEKILAPPYDTLTPQTHRYYQQQNPYNAIHLEVPSFIPAEEIDSLLVSINAKLKYWLNEDILTRSPTPSLYIYKQSYKDPLQDRIRQRIGIISAVFIDPHHIASIKPHEHVKEEHILSRMKYLESIRLQTNPILFLHEFDDEIQERMREITRKEPFIQVNSSRYETHHIYLVDNDDDIRFFQKKFMDKELVIADGHHRFESLRRLNTFHGDHLIPYALACLVGAEENNAYTLGYHRLIQIGGRKGVQKFQGFVQKYFKETETIPMESLHETLIHKISPLRIGLVFRGERDIHVYELRPEFRNEHPIFNELTTIDIVDNKIIGEFQKAIDEAILIEYTPWMHELFHRIDNKNFDIGILLDSISYHLVLSAGEMGLKLPPKSTYFYPKLPTGLVMLHQ